MNALLLVTGVSVGYFFFKNSLVQRRYYVIGDEQQFWVNKFNKKAKYSGGRVPDDRDWNVPYVKQLPHVGTSGKLDRMPRQSGFINDYVVPRSKHDVILPQSKNKYSSTNSVNNHIKTPEQQWAARVYKITSS